VSVHKMGMGFEQGSVFHVQGDLTAAVNNLGGGGYVPRLGRRRWRGGDRVGECLRGVGFRRSG
ncbi:hypothetical protein, partial [Nocardia cyriacigeorgica]|uniref:hypothetical protein n=1 Tax=Nocardia cyriacigeorgica TaxID=135487 RepID=UPI00245678B1